MTLLANRKSVMTLFTGSNDIDGHRVRIVLAEKGIAADMLEVGTGNLPDDLKELNPYQSIPTLVDRELALFDAQIIMEYLDERFPHPPLMPVDPVSRARCRMMLYRIERDWFPLVITIETGRESAAETARKQLREQLISIAPLFSQKPYFLSDEFSLVDCALAPILWRLEKFRIELPPSCKNVNEYAKRIFRREAFRASLLEAEKEMR